MNAGIVTVLLGKALICFAGTCHPALVGPNTPTGTFAMQPMRTTTLGYGGDVLAFKLTDRDVYAIHRVWLQDPAQRRAWRLHHGTARDRHITAGCVNVAPAVYQALAGYAVVRIER